jgi:hypothetical protein
MLYVWSLPNFKRLSGKFLDTQNSAELDPSNPETPKEMIEPHLKRDKAEFVKRPRKISSKETVIQSLEHSKPKGMFARLFAFLYLVACSAEFSQTSAVSSIEDKALQDTLDTRIAERAQIMVAVEELRWVF